MRGKRARALLLTIAAAAVTAMLVAACSGSGDEAASVQETAPRDGAVTSAGVLAPDNYLVFQGQQYKSTALLQEFEVDPAAMVLIGEIAETNVDHHGSTGVYQLRNDESSAVYTRSNAFTVEGEEGGVPALWFRWEPAN